MGSFHSRDESLVFELPPEFQKLSIIRLMRGCTACTVAFAAGPEPWFVRFASARLLARWVSIVQSDRGCGPFAGTAGAVSLLGPIACRVEAQLLTFA